MKSLQAEVAARLSNCPNDGTASDAGDFTLDIHCVGDRWCSPGLPLCANVRNRSLVRRGMFLQLCTMQDLARIDHYTQIQASMTTHKKIFVTGIGVITSIGSSRQEFWSECCHSERLH